MRGLKWPNQGNPTDKEWEIWRNALSRTVSNNHLKLHTQLGNWNYLPCSIWWYNSQDKSLYFGHRPGNIAQRWVQVTR